MQTTFPWLVEHDAFESHPPLLVSQGSGMHVPETIINPALQLHTAVPWLLVHAALLPHPPLLVRQGSGS